MDRQLGGAPSLPTFLGIGAQKAGTTWLHSQLQAHPQIYVPTQCKEIHFFDWFYERGLDWYRSFFPGPAEDGYFKAIGEVAPRYLLEPQIPERIARDLEDPRLIVMLRNPVDRFYSQYRMSLFGG